MSPNLWPRPALLVIAGAVVLSTAACAGSENKPTASSPGPASTTVTRHAGGHDRVGGLISSVSGHTIQVKTPDGTGDIDFNTMTKLTEVQPGELSDVIVGSCVSVLAAPADASDAITAQRVQISAAEDNKCAVDTPPGGAPPPGIAPGPPPAGPEGPPPGAPPFDGPTVHGAVASVNGNTIVVTNTDPTGAAEIQSNIAVTADTKYDKRQPVEATAIATGKCADARGTKDAQGVLQATKINLGPAADERCGPPVR